MTTQPHLSPRDWALLSAYLDDELSPRERRRLETRLQRETALQQALQQLSQTRAVLRQAPRLRAPRAFTLSPAAVGRRPTAAPLLRWVSLAATVLLAVMLVGDFWLSAKGQPRTIPPVEAPMVAQQAPTVAAEKAGAPDEAETEHPPRAVMVAPESTSPPEKSPSAAVTPSPMPAPAARLTPPAPPSPAPPLRWRWAELALAAVALITAWLARRWR